MRRSQITAALSLLAALLLTPIVTSRAADITRQLTSSAERPIIRIGGDFQLGDHKRFIELALPLDGALVVFDNSNGGALDAALQIGKAIRLKEFDTSVAANAQCASACAYTWLAGKRRYMEPNAKVGFHAAYQIDADGKPKTSGSANALIGAYLAGLALSTEAMIYITDPGPEEMRWLSLAQVNEAGIFAQTAQVVTADIVQHEPEDESGDNSPLPEENLLPEEPERDSTGEPETSPRPKPFRPKVKPSSQPEYVAKDGIQIWGPDLWEGQTPSAESCKLECTARGAKCGVYSFNVETKTCALRWFAQFSFRNIQVSSGYRTSPAQFMRELPFAVVDGFNLTGSGLSSLRGVSLIGCMEACARESKCPAFTYGAGQQCWLMKWAGRFIPRSGVTSGLRDPGVDSTKPGSEDADRKAREEAIREAQEEAERLAKEEAERLAEEGARRLAQEEADRKAREEAVRKAQEEIEHQAQEEAGEAHNKFRNTWVIVTRPMLSCGSTQDSAELKERLLSALARPMPGRALPEGCSLLSVGDKYLLDDEQTESETQIVVKMWAGVCPKGCLPTMTPVYAPPRRLVGRYLKPTSPPHGWE